jgi:NADPH2:quinone reductase
MLDNGTETMRAIWYERCGPASEVLSAGDIDTPEPGKGEVRVRLVTSGVNPVDVKRRSGGRGPMPTSPVIPHFDGAGVIDRVGAKVPESRMGERVWVYEAQWQRSHGTAAEYIALPADRTVRMPGRTTFAEGACLGVPAMTAHRCVFADGPVSDQTILVTGGAGSVGSYAIQFAKLEGARVITTVSTDEKARVASEVGADHVVNYKNEDVAARVREITNGEGVDRIVEVEFGGNLEVSLAVLKPNGCIATYAAAATPEPTLPFYRLAYGNVTIQYMLVFGMPDTAKRYAVADITSWLEAGDLRHTIAARFPLDRAAEAHEAVERGALGKVLLSIREDTPGEAPTAEAEEEPGASAEAESRSEEGIVDQRRED